MTNNNLDVLLKKVHQCQLCQQQLPFAAKPILQCSAHSKILIAGQAPGKITHEQGIAFDDPSGQRLREWLGVSKAQFYDLNNFAILPMGFCYPGRGTSGDLPPIPVCAQTWREALLAQLEDIKFSIVIGKYAIAWHIDSKSNVSEQVKNWQALSAKNMMVLPHPSPRNNIWLNRNPWFEEQVVPVLQHKVQQILFNK